MFEIDTDLNDFAGNSSVVPGKNSFKFCSINVCDF